MTYNNIYDVYKHHIYHYFTCSKVLLSNRLGQVGGGGLSFPQGPRLSESHPGPEERGHIVIARPYCTRTDTSSGCSTQRALCIVCIAASLLHKYTRTRTLTLSHARAHTHKHTRRQSPTKQSLLTADHHTHTLPQPRHTLA